jgi:hypothetical protein
MRAFFRFQSGKVEKVRAGTFHLKCREGNDATLRQGINDERFLFRNGMCEQGPCSGTSKDDSFTYLSRSPRCFSP